MTVLVVGASGATGKLLVERLVETGQKVRVVVRPTSNIPTSWAKNENVTIIKLNIAEADLNELTNYVKGCQAIASCLGHNISWKGLFGEPRMLVSGAVSLLCDAVLANEPERPIRFVLMNTAGNSNGDLEERVSFGQRMLIRLLRLLVPPHRDNEQAADYLRINIGQNNPFIRWVAVRPDTLINEEKVSAYSLHASPTRSAIFNPGKTSRINVAQFMSRLMTNGDAWNTWNGQMPVIYNGTDIGQRDG